MEDEKEGTLTWCPEFYPTKEEFANFSGYIEKCVSTLGKQGIFKVSFVASLIQFFKIKVIPPKTWVARKEGY